MNKNGISLNQAIKISKVKIPETDEHNWRRMGFIGALLGVNSAHYFREDHGVEYEKGYKLGEE
jgi:hypothetical protein